MGEKQTLYEKLVNLDYLYSIKNKKYISDKEYLHIIQILGKYDLNPIFASSKNKGRTIENAAADLIEADRGIKKLLPRRKDRAMNSEISRLEDLIYVPPLMKTRGILFPDNPLTITFWSILGYAAYAGLQKIFPELPDMTTTQQVIIPATILLAVGAIRFFEPSKEQAKYIDKKLRMFSNS